MKNKIMKEQGEALSLIRMPLTYDLFDIPLQQETTN